MNELRAKESEQRKALSKLESDLEAVRNQQAALEAEVKLHYQKHASKASKLGSADVAAEYQRIKSEVAAKTAKIGTEYDALQAQLQVGPAAGTWVTFFYERTLWDSVSVAGLSPASRQPPSVSQFYPLLD